MRKTQIVGTDRPKRLHIPIAVKREVAKRQAGICQCGCNTPIWNETGKCLVQWDHDPALRIRDINRRGTDYIPPQLDPAHIVARCPVSHHKKTRGTGATTAGTDVGAIKKLRKRERKPKPKRPIPSRPFSKQHRPFNSKWSKS